MNEAAKISGVLSTPLPLAGGVGEGLGGTSPIGAGPSPALSASGGGADVDALGEKIVAQLRTVFDPEIPVNIYDLGLIYTIDVKPLAGGKADVRIDMTLTTPNCPVAAEMPAMVQNAVLKLDDINDAKISLVWDPPWDKSRMSDEAMLHLNMF